MAQRLVNKAQLAALMQISLPTLDHRLRSDAGFPVVTRGGKNQAWSFDWVAVRRYLAKTGVSGARKSAEPSGAARMQDAQAKILEAKLARMTADLIERQAVLEAVGAAALKMGKAFDALPGQLQRQLDLSSETVDALRENFDGFRREFVRSLGEHIDVIDEPVPKPVPKPIGSKGKKGARRKD